MAQLRLLVLSSLERRTIWTPDRKRPCIGSYIVKDNARMSVHLAHLASPFFSAQSLRFDCKMGNGGHIPRQILKDSYRASLRIYRNTTPKVSLYLPSHLIARGLGTYVLVDLVDQLLSIGNGQLDTCQHGSIIVYLNQYQ